MVPAYLLHIKDLALGLGTQKNSSIIVMETQSSENLENSDLDGGLTFEAAKENQQDEKTEDFIQVKVRMNEKLHKLQYFGEKYQFCKSIFFYSDGSRQNDFM